MSYYCKRTNHYSKRTGHKMVPPRYAPRRSRARPLAFIRICKSYLPSRPSLCNDSALANKGGLTTPATMTFCPLNTLIGPTSRVAPPHHQENMLRRFSSTMSILNDQSVHVRSRWETIVEPKTIVGVCLGLQDSCLNCSYCHLIIMFLPQSRLRLWLMSPSQYVPISLHNIVQ